MAHKFDIAVFIGRFEPFHNGHLAVIDRGLEIAREVLVLVGSASSPRCYRNPFTFSERKAMILSAAGSARIHVHPLDDSAYNDAQWVANVQKIVHDVAGTGTVTLIGHSKDASSYYLKLFPQWANAEVPSFGSVNSTDIRTSYFSNIGHMWLNDADTLVPLSVKQFLGEFINTVAYEKIKQEYEFVVKYKAAWANSPYPPTFVCVDAVVVQSGHILLVKRGAQPGLGQWALPGGFVNQDERIADAVIRELREETGIKVPEPVLRGCVIAREVFDDPHRSSRGRTITHASLIKLKDDVALPKVKGGDDAAKARWVPIAALNPKDFFEDHYFIIQNLVGRI